jgi:TRAP transporter 4TM/12TM fusion protein
VFATFVFVFIIFGAFLEHSGASRFFIDFPNAAFGRYTGGPAKAAVMASGLMGSIAGSAVANVVTTGAFTIPLMKRNGFPPHTAAAVETTASTGGQILPPIMGAGAFIISEFTGYSYLNVIKVAVIPALIYYASIMFVVHTEARKMGIKGLTDEELPPLGATFRRGWYYMLPVVAIIGLLVSGYSPPLSAFYAIVTTVAISMIKKETRMSVGSIGLSFRTAALNSLSVGATTGALGIIIGTIFLTGVGLKFSDFLITASGGVLPITIIMIAIASYVLGMGMTVTSSYIVLAVLAAPALTELGVSLMAAHLLIFWYSQDANITPPVCLAAYAGAAVAGADPMKTGFKALLFAKPLYIIPFLFVYTPILFTGPLAAALQTIFTCTIGMLAATAALQRWLVTRATWMEVGMLVVCSVALFIPTWTTDLAGLVLFSLVFLAQINRRKRGVALTGPASS